MSLRPNVIFVFADQWRAQACGYAGDPNVKTPNLDRLAAESVNFRNAISSAPVCSPYRASLITGQYPLTHGIFLNDAPLSDQATSVAEAFAAGGYQTAYIGKWHIDGNGRDSYIPPARRQGFSYWKVRECTHKYNHSMFYDHDCQEPVRWEGYDAIAQTKDAQQYIRKHDPTTPFFLMLSWGPPHNPYETAPEQFRQMYDPEMLELRPNVPEEMAAKARQWLAGYYAHCSALDYCVGELLQTLKDVGADENTVFVFTSDHGDMLGSHGQQRKQKPYQESVRVPFLLRYPQGFGHKGKVLDGFLDAPDIMPTLLGLCGLEIPASTQGRDFSSYILGTAPDPSNGEGLVACYHPFGEFEPTSGGIEYRGLLTERFTYVKTLEGPWLLYDNLADPYQLENLIHRSDNQRLCKVLDERLDALLERLGDRFSSGSDYVSAWGYEVDEHGTIPCPSKL